MFLTSIVPWHGIWPAQYGAAYWRHGFGTVLRHRIRRRKVSWASGRRGSLASAVFDRTVPRPVWCCLCMISPIGGTVWCSQLTVRFLAVRFQCGIWPAVSFRRRIRRRKAVPSDRPARSRGGGGAAGPRGPCGDAKASFGSGVLGRRGWPPGNRPAGHW